MLGHLSLLEESSGNVHGLRTHLLCIFHVSNPDPGIKLCVIVALQLGKQTRNRKWQKRRSMFIKVCTEFVRRASISAWVKSRILGNFPEWLMPDWMKMKKGYLGREEGNSSPGKGTYSPCACARKKGSVSCCNTSNRAHSGVCRTLRLQRVAGTRPSRDS